VTRGGQLRSIEDSALDMSSVILDFVVKHRCQVGDTSLQPGGVMRFGHPHLVGNAITLNLGMQRVKRRSVSVGSPASRRRQAKTAVEHRTRAA